VTGFESNLLAGAVILTIDLIVTYGIVTKVINDREKRLWRPVSQIVLDNLKSANEITILVWAFQARPEIVPKNFNFSRLNHTEIQEALKREVREIQDLGPPMAAARPDDYWIKVSTGLGSSRHLAKDALDRSQFALQERPDIVAILLDLERSHRTLSAFRDDQATFQSGIVVSGLPEVTFRTLEAHLRLSEAIS